MTTIRAEVAEIVAEVDRLNDNLADLQHDVRPQRWEDPHWLAERANRALRKCKQRLDEGEKSKALVCYYQAIGCIIRAKRMLPKVEPRLDGTFYKIASAVGTVGRSTTPIAVDTTKMCATVVICTNDVDRDDEIIEPAGVNVEKYRKNPVVLWNHGFQPAIPLPIAKCEHPDGSLALVQTRESITGTGYFSASNKESSQIFGLIAEGVVRGASIHVQPITMGAKMVNRRRITVCEESELLEWSFVDVPCNGEAVMRTLAHNKINGETLLPSVRRSLLGVGMLK